MTQKIKGFLVDRQVSCYLLVEYKNTKANNKGELTSESGINNMKKGENNIDFYVILPEHKYCTHKFKCSSLNEMSDILSL